MGAVTCQSVYASQSDNDVKRARREDGFAVCHVASDGYLVYFLRYNIYSSLLHIISCSKHLNTCSTLVECFRASRTGRQTCQTHSWTDWASSCTKCIKWRCFSLSGKSSPRAHSQAGDEPARNLLSVQFPSEAEHAELKP